MQHVHSMKYYTACKKEWTEANGTCKAACTM